MRKEPTLWDFFKQNRRYSEDSNDFKAVRFLYTGRHITVLSTKKRAGRRTHIHCKADNTIYREDFYPFGGMSAPSRVEKVLIKPENKKDETLVIVIKGKPGIITGLDEGFFVSAHGTPKNNSPIYVMSERAFKYFSLKN